MIPDILKGAEPGDVEMVYLGCPYSHPTTEVRKIRVACASAAAAKLMSEGHLVFSPLTYTHVLLRAPTVLPESWDFWRQVSLAFLARCSMMFVLPLHGWRDSVGLNEEADFCELHGKDIVILDPSYGFQESIVKETN